ncbi:MAG: hypothetical protein ACRC2U_07785 [Aeromonas sp.]
MAQYDLSSDIFPSVALNTAAITSSTTTTGTNIIDTQGYGAVVFVLNVGARTDGTYTLVLEHGDAANLSDTSAPAASDLNGTLAATAANTAQTIKRIGYVGNKRYVRANVVSTGVTRGAPVGVLAIRGRPTVRPAPAN